MEDRIAMFKNRRLCRSLATAAEAGAARIT